MRAIILAPFIKDLGSSSSNETLKALLQKLSPIELGACIVAGLAVCAVFGWIVYMLLCVFLERRRLPAATNSLGESIAIVCLFLLLGRGLGMALERLGWTDILVRMGGTILTGCLCVGALAAVWHGRNRGAAFPFWDLRPYEGGARLLTVVPLLLMAFVPVNIAVSVGWRCVLVALDRPTEMQEVLLAPLERGGAVIPIFMVLAVAVVPLLEEIIFRGGLYRALRTELGAGAGAVLSSIIFAALHANEAALLPLVVLSLFLVAVYEWSGSLWGCVLLHACFNALNFTLA